MAIGVFAGMLPIIPFQTALALALALLVRGSKITAMIGTWVSNPLNWYLIYFMDYKLGAVILGLPEKNRGFASVMTALQQGDDGMAVVKTLLGAGGPIMAAFLLGGLILGVILAPISYPVFHKIFQAIARWRDARRTFKYLSRKRP
jgi:uncharacterized protein (DUF2062 family)